MRGWFGLLGLLLVLAVVGLLARKQMTALQTPLPTLQAPANEAASAPAGNVREQSQQLQQQYKSALEGALQTPRPQPDDQ